jgi:hypothetical protein
MRQIACLPMLFLLLSGCAGFPRSPSPEATELAASLSYVAGDLPLEPGSGIVSVGDYYFPNGYPRLVHLAPGRREVGYYCGGQIYVDGPPTVTYDFEGGRSYKLYCQKGQAHIRIVQPAGGPNPSSKRTREKPRAA